MIKFINIFNKSKKRKLTCLISGGLGNQLSMASLAEIFAIENNFDVLNFEYRKPFQGEKRNCELKKYVFSQKFEIFDSIRLIQTFYKILIKLNLINLKIIVWRNMRISLIRLPFKYQMEFRELELGILFDRELFTNAFLNSQLIKRRKYKLIDECIIHFRDYEAELGLKGKKYQLKEKYFLNAIKMLKIPAGSEIKIICFKKNINKFTKLSKDYNLKYLTNENLNTELALEKMRNAKTLIMSNSTLSWWGAFTEYNIKKPRKIIFPSKFSEGLVAWRENYRSNYWYESYE